MGYSFSHLEVTTRLEVGELERILHGGSDLASTSQLVSSAATRNVTQAPEHLQVRLAMASPDAEMPFVAWSIMAGASWSASASREA